MVEKSSDFGNMSANVGYKRKGFIVMTDIKIPRFGLNPEWANHGDPKYTFGEKHVYNMDPDPKHGRRDLFAGRIYTSYTELAFRAPLPVLDFCVHENPFNNTLDIIDKSATFSYDKEGRICDVRVEHPIRFVPMYSIQNAKLREVGCKTNRLPDQTRMESTVFNMIYNMGFDDKPQDTSNRFFTSEDGFTGAIFKAGVGTYILLYLVGTKQKQRTLVYTISDKKIIFKESFVISNVQKLKGFLTELKAQRDNYLQRQYGE